VIHLGIDGKRILMNKTLDSVANTDPAYSPEDIEAFRTMGTAFEQEYIKHVVTLTQKYEKPVLGVSLLTDAASKTLYRVDGARYNGVFFPSPERAVRALAGMCKYQQWLERR